MNIILYIHTSHTAFQIMITHTHTYTMCVCVCVCFTIHSSGQYVICWTAFPSHPHADTARSASRHRSPVQAGDLSSFKRILHPNAFPVLKVTACRLIWVSTEMPPGMFSGFFCQKVSTIRENDSCVSRRVWPLCHEWLTFSGTPLTQFSVVSETAVSP